MSKSLVPMACVGTPGRGRWRAAIWPISRRPATEASLGPSPRPVILKPVVDSRASIAQDSGRREEETNRTSAALCAMMLPTRNVHSLENGQ